MSLREWVLGFLLAVAGGFVVRGVIEISTAAAWIVAGVLTAALSWLLLGEVTVEASPPSGDGS